MKKIHFSSLMSSRELDKRFRRQAFYLLSSSIPAVLIHYLGNENLNVDFPHGNSKQNASDHHRTCPSLLHKMSTTVDLPSNVYKKVISSIKCPPELQPSCMPRNKRQIINLQQRERQRTRLSHDALYNLHELAYDLGDFVKQIATFPDLVVICGLPGLLTEFDLLLQLESTNSQLLSYDTTFQLGDFYLSPLLYRQNLFSGSPVIPALFLIHERKFKSVHEQFMKCLSQLVPTLVKGDMVIPLVTDEEVGINSVSAGMHCKFVALS